MNRPSVSLVVRCLVAITLIPMLAVQPLFAWGIDGHRMINRIAMEKLPADVPAFLKTPVAINEVEYLGPEPDRWRSPAEPELSNAQAPEHFMDLELADMVGTLPRTRFEFMRDLTAAQQAHPDMAKQLTAEKTGLLPYEATEVYERLKAAFREYRTMQAKGEDTHSVEQAVLFYAGWLGHYAGDGSMPLHTSIHYNGWVGKENPNGYTTEHHIHAQFESEFVHDNIGHDDVAPLVGPVKTLGDVETDFIAYLRVSNSLVEKTYQIEKAGGITGKGTPEGKQFVAERVAAGAAMLRDLIYTAWVESAKPVPEWHEPKAPAAGAKPGNR